MARNLLSIINFEGLSSDLPEWKKCGRILFLCLVIPWSFLLVLAEWISWQAGDWLSLAQAAMLQTEHPNLVWYKYRGVNFARFKLARVAIDRPDILIFGESRSQMFRSAMFRPYSAYNLSSTCYLLTGFTDLLRHLPQGYNPKVIIMTCDFWLFNPVYTAAQIKGGHALQNFTPSWKDKLDDVHDILVQLPNQPSLLLIGFYHPYGYPTLGLGAYLEPGGFRKDGSIQRDPSEKDDPSKLKALPDANLDYGDRMGSDEMEQFEEFVSEVHARGIALVCVQLPCYWGKVHNIEYGQKTNFGELQDFTDHVKNGYFDRLHVLFFDFLNLAGYSDKAEYFFDTVHPKEALTLEVLSEMASDPRFLALLPKLDVAAMKEKLARDQRSQNHNNLYPTNTN
jgi:hypothetical protein